MTQDIAAIAGKLTKAGWRVVMACSPEYPVMHGRPRTLRVLARDGLCHPPKHWEITITDVLARPLGLAVRAHLQRIPEHAD